MPFYQCQPAPGLVGAPERIALAEAITRVHTEVTGAPAVFVNVGFTDRAEDTMFTAGRPSQQSIVTGFIRTGRDRETREALLTGISVAWNRITGQDVAHLVIGLIDVDPTSAMEAGLVMPAPGEEEAWFANNHDALEVLIGADNSQLLVDDLLTTSKANAVAGRDS